jgi:hypothetical protein
MLTIRKEQIKVFRDYVRRQFENRMKTHLKNNFSDMIANIPEQDLCDLIQVGIDRALGHGIVLVDDIQRFLECMFTYGHVFGENSDIPWAYDILREEGLTGTQKMDRIDAYTIFVLGGE